MKKVLYVILVVLLIAIVVPFVFSGVNHKDKVSAEQLRKYLVETVDEEYQKERIFYLDVLNMVEGNTNYTVAIQLKNEKFTDIELCEETAEQYVGQWMEMPGYDQIDTISFTFVRFDGKATCTVDLDYPQELQKENLRDSFRINDFTELLSKQ